MGRTLLMYCILLTVLHGEFLSLYFRGNEKIKDRDLYEVLNLYKPYIYEFWKKNPTVSLETAPLLVETIKNFYKYKGFFHTFVTYAQAKNHLEIIISEETPIRVANITENFLPTLKSHIRFTKDEIFDSEKFEKSKKEIKQFYANKGFCNMKLDAKVWIDIEANSADIMYDISPGQLCSFGTITIHPSKNIDLLTIRSLLYVKEGEPFSPERIRQSYQSLYGREGIQKVMIETTISDENKASLVVQITETEKPIRFQAGIGASSDMGGMISLGIKHRNLFGNLKTLSLNTRLTEIKQSVKSVFNMPLKDRSTTGLEIGYENEIFLGFKEKRLFGTLFLKQRGLTSGFQESMILDKTQTYASEDQDLFPEGSLFVLSPKLEWNYDTRDTILDPKKGYFLHSELMGSLQSMISDASFYKFKLSAAYILPLLPSVIAAKVDFGTVRLYTGDIPASYLFYAGGMNSNRAYTYRTLGPKNDSGDPIGLDSILEVSLELRFPIYGNFRGILFSDSSFLGKDSSPNYHNGYYSAGVGIRYMTPIGPIALDFGFDIKTPIEQYAFHFHIGELF